MNVHHVQFLYLENRAEMICMKAHLNWKMYLKGYIWAAGKVVTLECSLINVCVDVHIS